MDKRPSAVTRAVTAHVSALQGPPLPLPAELHYEITDPYAVRISLGASNGPLVTWVFARELLAQGLRCPTGTGDVVVIPKYCHHSHTVRIVLRNSSGVALVEMGATEVAAFVQQSFDVVPAGAERDHLNLDDLITALVGRSGDSTSHRSDEHLA
ncbi:SsgA family sporulation/cell division regulator [Streptomyces sp. NPDC005406]|uniref:SsgA family sporulation/cell division regulator n=1 Tax=Streptomyces sp. NPDC005406 TaxID=3155339 RepID=UPI0034571BE1